MGPHPSQGWAWARGAGGGGDVGSPGKTLWDFPAVINLNASASFTAKLPRSPSNDVLCPRAVAQKQ